MKMDNLQKYAQRHLVWEVLEATATEGANNQRSVQERSLDFAVHILEFSDALVKGGRRIISEQILRSGTSIGANVHEAQNAESPRDFLHKMKIAAKEAEETEYWLLLCRGSSILPDPGGLLDELLHIKRLLARIIASTKHRVKT